MIKNLGVPPVEKTGVRSSGASLRCGADEKSALNP